jgi:LmbE family N-acetylglucosaminyl deacetylase
MTSFYPSASAYARPSGRRRRLSVLVIAPHPDDDVIGCGGTLGRLAGRGARVAVTYVTDGSASHVKSKRFPPAVLRTVREGEARAALRHLGVRGEPQFLRAPDGRLAEIGEPERQQLAVRVAERIVAVRAQIVFSPWPRDPHPDHVATAEIAAAALAICPRRPAVYLYRVWLPVRGAAADQPRHAEARVREVRLTAAELARKRAAIMEHRSQTGALIDDDPDGFCIGPELLATWLTPVERFYRQAPAKAGPAERIPESWSAEAGPDMQEEGRTEG